MKSTSMAYLNRSHLTQLYTSFSISLYSPLSVVRIKAGRRRILNKKMFMFAGKYNRRTGILRSYYMPELNTSYLLCGVQRKGLWVAPQRGNSTETHGRKQVL